MLQKIGYVMRETRCRDCGKPLIVNGYSQEIWHRCESCAGDAARREDKERQERAWDAIRDEIIP